MAPLVSILIPCYNAERWVGTAVRSALAQTYSHTEVIAIDDGSTDGSRAVLRQFEPAIAWEAQPNRGGNITRNRLLALSSGEWIQYLDADDCLLPDKISGQLQAITGNNPPDLIYSPHLWETREGEGVTRPPSAVASYPQPHDLWLLAIRWQIPQTGGLLLRRQALQAVGGWDERIKHCQDYDLWIRLLMAGQSFHYCPPARAVYRWWCSGTMTRRNRAEVYQARLNIQDRIEQYLAQTQQLFPTRLEALKQVRFEYARRIYSWDRAWATQLAERIESQDPSFRPDPTVAPGSYRLAYRLLGFRGAERLAHAKRYLASHVRSHS